MNEKTQGSGMASHTSYRLHCLSAHCPSASGICTQCIKYLHKASNICISREKAIFCGHKQAHMAFEWKAHKDIFKGSWIYHLTFAVAGRRPLLWNCAHVALPRILPCWLLSHSYIGGCSTPPAYRRERPSPGLAA